MARRMCIYIGDITACGVQSIIIMVPYETKTIEDMSKIGLLDYICGRKFSIVLP